MKKSAYAGLIVFVGWVVLSILQLWSNILNFSTYWKISVTGLLALVAIVVAGLIHREYIEEKEMKEKGYIE